MSEQRRTRIDAILNAIEKGEYDDKLTDLRLAVTNRTRTRQEEVLALVHEVYGPGYTVTITGQNSVQKTPFEAPKLSNTDVPEPYDTRTESISVPEPFAEDPKEREMEPDIERRGGSIGGIGPGDIQ